jgi:site-specific DNA-methyltransferase (adenine-specific)
MRGDLVDNRNGSYANANGRRINNSNSIRGHDDNGGSAARFFPHLGYGEHDLDIPPIKYCSKASKSDRDEGCEGMEESSALDFIATGIDGRGNPYKTQPRHNHHVSVKPTDLMRWLCRLIVPPGGVVLDPFMGSGSTLKAACLEGMRCVGIEMDAEYFEIAMARVRQAQQQGLLNLEAVA